MKEVTYITERTSKMQSLGSGYAYVDEEGVNMTRNPLMSSEEEVNISAT